MAISEWPRPPSALPMNDVAVLQYGAMGEVAASGFGEAGAGEDARATNASPNTLPRSGLPQWEPWLYHAHMGAQTQSAL